MVTLEEKIKEIKKELSYREYVFPRLVNHGTMLQGDSDRRMVVLRAVLGDYLAMVPKQGDMFE